MRRGFVAAIVVALLACSAAVTSARAEFTSPIPFSRDTVPADFCRVVRQDLLDREFTQLEATHKAAVSLEARFEGGKPELEVFYDALSENDCTSHYSCKDDPTFEAREQRLEEWLRRKSDPATANLALARFWWEAAWEARGCGFANTVTTEQWQTFAERLKLSAGYAHHIDVESDPEAGRVLLGLARDFSAPPEQAVAVFTQARMRFPTYFVTYQQFARMTLPKWSGRGDLTARFMQSLASEPGGAAGDMAYSIVAEDLAYEIKPDRLYTADTGLTWPRVKRTFAAREKLLGLNARDWNLLCYLAFVAQDRDTARSALKHIDGEVQTWPWTGTDNFYAGVLPWINSDADPQP